MPRSLIRREVNECAQRDVMNQSPRVVRSQTPENVCVAAGVRVIGGHSLNVIIYIVTHINEIGEIARRFVQQQVFVQQHPKHIVQLPQFIQIEFVKRVNVIFILPFVVADS